jgi:hypothetical protein
MMKFEPNSQISLQSKEYVLDTIRCSFSTLDNLLRNDVKCIAYASLSILIATWDESSIPALSFAKMSLIKISGFCSGLVEAFALLACHMAQAGNWLPVFWDNTSVPSSRISILLGMLDVWRLGQYVVQQHWQPSANICCVISQESKGLFSLINFQFYNLQLCGTCDICSSDPSWLEGAPSYPPVYLSHSQYCKWQSEGTTTYSSMG